MFRGTHRLPNFSTGKSRSTAQHRRQKLVAEMLESRCLLSATLGLGDDQGIQSDSGLVAHSEGVCRPASPVTIAPTNSTETAPAPSILSSSTDTLTPQPNELLAEGGEPLVLGKIPLPPKDLSADYARYLLSLSPAMAPSSTGSGDPGNFQLGNLSPEDTFFLHSKPDATKTIYLDFDGFTATGTPWNSSYNRDPIVSPPYDPAGDGAEFSNAELVVMQQLWHRVAEDFAPFDVNVTTEDPGEAALVNTGGSDNEWGLRAVFTVDDWANCGCGGFAYINSFNWGYNSAGATDTPTYIFNRVGAEAALAATHEVGHALGLSHDGTTAAHPTQPNAGYYSGHGSGETAWGPVMGAPYYTNVVTWDQGEYIGSNNAGSNANFNNGPDDLEIITTRNGFDYREDDHGNTNSTATELNYLGPNAADPEFVDISQFGIIETTSDVDVFTFITGSGTINIDILSYAGMAYVADGSGNYDVVIEDTTFSSNWGSVNSSNLDILASLYDGSGNLVATSNPTGLSASFTDITVNSGTYYITIDGVGFGNPADPNAPTGYTEYGSLGQYFISGVVVEAGGPVASASAQDIDFATENPMPILVTYVDRDGVDVSTLGTGDIRVVGPNGYSQIATFISVNNQGDGSPRFANYTVPAPNGNWNSDANGTYTIQYVANEVADVGGNFNEAANIGSFLVDVAPNIGPDGYGYEGIPARYQFTNITNTGTLILDGEDEATQLLVPGNGFSFDFYGTTYDRLYVSSNGIITFEAPYSLYLNSDLTQSPTPKSFAVLWDDLVAPSGAGVYWQLTGSGDSQKLILQWETEYFGAPDGISFQAVLDESDMSLSAYYRDLVGGSSESDNAGSATVGIKDAATQGSRRLLATFDSADNNYAAEGRGLKFLVTNHFPTDITFTPAQNTENSPVGTVFGTFAAADLDGGDSHTFELVNGAGDNDNGRFEIVGNELKNLEVFDFEDRSEFNIRVRTTDQDGASVEVPLTIALQDLPEMELINVAGGQLQRSLVDTVDVVFDGLVDIASDAFTVNKRGAAGGTVETSFTTSTDAFGRTVATITFSGTFARSTGTLVNGNYELLIDASKVTRSGVALDGNSDGTAGGDISFGTDASDAFFALFGDANGDRAVGFADFVAFRSTYGLSSGDAGYNEAFDLDGSDTIGFSDFNAFRTAYGSSLDFE